MTKLIGFNKFRTVIFISGNGSNFKNLIKFSKLKNSPITIHLVISSNSKAKGLAFAKKYKIKKKFLDSKNKRLMKIKFSNI